VPYVFVGFQQLKKDKVELENQLEQEQEALVNRLWKRMDKLEAEKRCCARFSVIYVVVYSCVGDWARGIA